jgi:hypothetical protein
LFIPERENSDSEWTNRGPAENACRQTANEAAQQSVTIKINNPPCKRVERDDKLHEDFENAAHWQAGLAHLLGS